MSRASAIYCRDLPTRKTKIISIIRKVYESFGFLPIETPGLEYLEILLGEYGEENTKQIFRFKSPDMPRRK